MCLGESKPRKSESPAPVVCLGESKPLPNILCDHAKKVLDSSGTFDLSVDRSSKENLWMTVMSFYKRAKSEPDRLKKDLVVKFR